MPGNMTTRKRDVKLVFPPYRVYSSSNTFLETAFSPIKGQQSTTSYRSGKGIEETVGNMMRENAQHFDRPFDTGHEFKTITNRLGGRIPFITGKGLHMTDVRSQAVLPTAVSGANQNFESIADWTDYAAIGNKFIKETSPTSPAADTITNLSEIFREGIPAVPGSALASIKKGDNPLRLLGGEFLNLSFGALPTLSGVLDIIEAVRQSEKIVKQYRADSGRIVRRRRLLDPEVKIERFAPFTTNFYALNSGYPLAGAQAQITKTRTTSIQYSFSAAYTYHLAQGDSLVASVERFSQEANRLYGLRFTPEVLYNLLPWSWLVDWFTNVGDNISVANALSNDQLVLKYGYVMKKTIIINNWTTPAFVYNKLQVPATNVSFYTIKKERKRATPFGFGLNTAAFSTQQWSILTALGMAKSAGSLR